MEKREFVSVLIDRLSFVYHLYSTQSYYYLFFLLFIVSGLLRFEGNFVQK